MSALMAPELDSLPRDVERSLEFDAPDAETLLVDWLGELAYLAESEGVVFASYELSDVAPTHMRATIRGGRPAELQKHIKAVTYHGLEIKPDPHGLTATIVFDV
jgi:SHS2 domain-containing protein